MLSKRKKNKFFKISQKIFFEFSQKRKKNFFLKFLKKSFLNCSQKQKTLKKILDIIKFHKMNVHLRLFP